MSNELQLFLLQKLLPTAFVFAVGSCVGSLISVLISRLPKGEDVVLKPSYCPKCDAKLKWYDNIPIIGWLKLGGRCRSCGNPISITYPFLEASVGAMFALIWMQCYNINSGQTFLGFEIWKLRPDWALSGWEQTWPLYAVVVACFSSLLAMTIIDARTFTIPTQLLFSLPVIGLVIHVGWAIVVQNSWSRLHNTAPGWLWSISHAPVTAWVPEMLLPAHPPGQYLANSTWWWWTGAMIGAAVGIAISMLMLKLGLIRRSFHDYEEWEKKQLVEQAAAASTPDGAPIDPESQRPADPTELWIAYPHARREMIKELAFLAAPVILALVGGFFTYKYTGQLVALPPGADTSNFAAVGGTYMPLWLMVLTGVLMGYMLAGGVLWFIRIAGTLGFGKEALGLGDIHLMAGVGACLGFIDAILAFFLSAPVALLGWVVGWAIAKATGNKKGTTMPYGPWLSIATVLVFVLKPLIEYGFTRLLDAKPPINWP